MLRFFVCAAHSPPLCFDDISFPEEECVMCPLSIPLPCHFHARWTQNWLATLACCAYRKWAGYEMRKIN